MRDDVVQAVHVAFDREVEAPTSGNPRLPNPPRLVVLLGLERRMAEVLLKEPGLLFKRFLYLRRSASKRGKEAL